MLYYCLYFYTLLPTDYKDTGSSYEIFANQWNSEEHGNVINLMVSATPWNLQTVRTRFELTEVGWNDNKLETIDDQVSGRAYHRKFKLHEMNWSASYDKAFKDGKEVILMVIVFCYITWSFSTCWKN